VQLQKIFQNQETIIFKLLGIFFVDSLHLAARTAIIIAREEQNAGLLYTY
jgi:hypothetical protein